MRVINRLSDLVYKIERFLVVILVGLMFIALTAGVLSRYFFKIPLHWADETAIFSLVWLTFIGGSMSLKQGGISSVTIFLDRMPERLRKTLIFITNSLVLAFALLILVYSIKWVLQPTIAFQMSPVMEVPMIYPYLCVPIGMLFFSIHSLTRFADTFKKAEQKEQSSLKEQQSSVEKEVLI